MPQFEIGDMWGAYATADLFLITTNATITARGTLVMGRGIARQAQDRFPGLAEALGQHILNICLRPRRQRTRLSPNNAPDRRRPSLCHTLRPLPAPVGQQPDQSPRTRGRIRASLRLGRPVTQRHFQIVGTRRQEHGSKRQFICACLSPVCA